MEWEFSSLRDFNVSPYKVYSCDQRKSFDIVKKHTKDWRLVFLTFSCTTIDDTPELFEEVFLNEPSIVKGVLLRKSEGVDGRENCACKEKHSTLFYGKVWFWQISPKPSLPILGKAIESQHVSVLGLELHCLDVQPDHSPFLTNSLCESPIEQQKCPRKNMVIFSLTKLGQIKLFCYQIVKPKCS